MDTFCIKMFSWIFFSELEVFQVIFLNVFGGPDFLGYIAGSSMDQISRKRKDVW